MKPMAVLCLVAAACSDDDDGGPPQTITILRDATMELDLLAVRRGDGAWQELPLDATSFDASGKFTLAGACIVPLDATTRFHVHGLRGATTSETTEVRLPCTRRPLATGAPTFPVSVEMLEPGNLLVGPGTPGASLTGPWTTARDLPAGAYPLVAWDFDRMAIRHDLAVDGPTTIPQVSLATEGLPFEDLAFTLDGEPPDIWYGRLRVGGEYSWNVYVDADGPVRLPPAGALTGTDARELGLLVETATTSREIYLENVTAATPRAFTLPPALAGVTQAGRTMRWTSLPEADSITLSANERYVIEQMVVTEGWLAGATAMTAEFTGVAGWDPAWPLVDADAIRVLSVGVRLDDAITSYTAYRPLP